MLQFKTTLPITWGDDLRHSWGKLASIFQVHEISHVQCQRRNKQTRWLSKTHLLEIVLSSYLIPVTICCFCYYRLFLALPLLLFLNCFGLFFPWAKGLSEIVSLHLSTSEVGIRLHTFYPPQTPTVRDNTFYTGYVVVVVYM